MTRHDFPATLTGAREHRLSVEEFVTLCEVVGPEVSRRWELWDGVVIEMAAEGPLHMRIVQRTMLLFVKLLLAIGMDGRLGVSPHGTLPLFERYVLSPDLMVLPLLDGVHLPTADDVALAFEASVTTLDYDLGPKLAKYGETSVAELWVADGEKGFLHVFRRDATGNFAPLKPLAAGETIAPLFAPGHPVAVADLF
jgi:Uma2 family endonuclease